ncbi:uridine phosphorylase 1-like [Condylostylus longicornis]|uniref:uridine phosphorylase 1-like n=1 Tax=Condylostylus longicornis TaxID=2530218 RepID=UPI00244E194E|nr:uridine phosphorylase 1-like [Condylostylus longicornis]XP_055381378.1 uridine phosphorylase 1-like [Condylostylus longicornis]
MSFNFEKNSNHSSNGNQNKDEGTVHLNNENLKLLKEDVLYHLALGTATHDLKTMFGDVKYVCMGGTTNRMKNFAEFITKELQFNFPVGTQLLDLCEKGNRFAMYKVGPVLSVSHGMGMPSLSILLHEMAKLMHYAKCIDPVFIRIGTSGGIGVPPGTVVVTSNPVNGFLKNEHEFIILGERVIRPAILDYNLSQSLIACSDKHDNFEVIAGKTMATDDFYEGQGRTDGAVCWHNEEQKFKFLKRAYNIGVRNIEMESTVFGALTHSTGIRAADVCVTIIDRLEGDQVTTTKEDKNQFELRPQTIVGRYIKKDIERLGLLKQK